MGNFNFLIQKERQWSTKLFAVLFFLIAGFTGNAQNNSLACNNLVQVSLDGDCKALINPDMILEGTYTNWNNYSVSISNVVGNVVTKVGFYTVTVTHIPTGNSCWGNITVEDKLAPQIQECPCALDNEDPECQFSCAELDGVLKGDILAPAPIVKENCTTYTTKITNHVTDRGCLGKVLKRTFIYTDVYGNVSLPCVSYYYFSPITFANVTPPVKNVQLTCGAKTDPQSIFLFFKPSLGTKVARTYAWPTINGEIITEEGVCNIAAAKTDSEVLACGPECPDSKKIIRTWTVLDWCKNESVNYVQIIKASDNKAPQVKANDLTVSTDPWGCTANITFPAPVVLKDDCSQKVDYKVEGPAGINIVFHNASKLWLALNVPKGKHKFIYKATDCCGNVGVDTIDVDVADRNAPTAISKEFIVVSLTNGNSGNGQAKVYAASIDNGSHDGCTPVKLEIRRDEDKCKVQGNATFNDDGHPFDGSSDPNSPNYDPDQGAFVKFCCEDLTGVENGVRFGTVKVWLRVWDDGDMNGVYGSAGDNYNETWSFVRVEDKLPPVLVCPKDVTLECDGDYTNLDQTGRATAYYTCGAGEAEYRDITSLNSCGQGTVLRRWSVKGYPNINCTQRITIKPTPAGGVTVKFPADITTDCKNLPKDQKPTFTGGPCNLLGYAVESDTFYIEEGACMKIINKFTVVDWCTYNPNSTNPVGIWKGTQTIKVIDDKAPVLKCKDEMFEVNDNGDADGDGNKCELKGLKLTAIADDNGDCSSKWLKWIVLVDINGDGTTEYEYSSFIPSTDNSFGTDSNLNGIPDVYLAPSGSNKEVMISIPADISGSMRNHKVLWRVTDGCGNITSCSSTFMVVDKKKPTPYCVSLSSAVMANCQVELWARDFDKGSFDNCTPAADLLFTFNGELPILSRINEVHYFKGNGQAATLAEFNKGDAQQWVPAFKSSSKIFDKDEVAQSPVPVKMSVWDAKGNTDFCTVTLTLIDNQGGCGPIAAQGCDGPTNEYTGMAVVTCNAEPGTKDNFVGAIIDIRNNATAIKGGDWGASIPVIHPSNWTVDSIGQIFGIAIDDKANVYLAASDVYNKQYNTDPYGAGQIFIASKPNFRARPFVSLTNTGGQLNGIGGIVYDKINKVLVASNLEDGKIYRIGLNGTILNSFDPWALDNGTPGIVAQDEQVWGLGINVENGVSKVYFARISDTERSIYSVALTSTGFASSTVKELNDLPGVGKRVTDIEFSSKGTYMVVSERGLEFLTGAHDSRVMRFNRTGNTWTYALKYEVGANVQDVYPSVPINAPGENSAGGVAIGYKQSNNLVNGECDGIVWATGNWMRMKNGNLIYGAQGMNPNGNNPSGSTTNPNIETDIFIDFDGTLDNFDQKGSLGEIEIFGSGSLSPLSGRISGNLTSMKGDFMNVVNVNIEGPNGYSKNIMTNKTFEFNNLQNGVYTVYADKTDDYLNGVSTIDLVLIQRHILGINKLTSPEKLLAADVNNDGKVTASDLVELRKLILGTITKLPNIGSWTFIPKETVFTDPLNPFNVSEKMVVTVNGANVDNANFNAIKIGDINDNASTNFNDNNTENRSSTSIIVNDRAVVTGEMIEVEFDITSLNASGYQMSLFTEGLEIVNFEFNGKADKSYYNLISANSANISWNGNGELAGIMKMYAKVETNGRLSDMIYLNERLMPSEIYVGDNLEEQKLQLVFRSENNINTDAFELYQNQPNPFKDFTTISFNLPIAQDASLTIFDVTGRVLKTETKPCSKGLNTFNVNMRELGNQGVLYYKVESGELNATKVMISLK